MFKNNKQIKNSQRLVREVKRVLCDSESGDHIKTSLRNKENISGLFKKARVPNGPITNRKK